MGFAGEFGRVKRRGDRMRGDLQFQVNTLVDLLTTGLVRGAGIRLNPITETDLEFYDQTVGMWIKLSDLGGFGMVTALLEEQIATPGQHVFTLAGAYPPGVDALWVFVDQLFIPQSMFTEDTPHQVTLDPGIPISGGEVVTFKVPKGVPSDANQVLITGADTTPNFVNSKIIGDGATIAATVINPGFNEQLRLSVIGGVGGAIIDHAQGAYWGGAITVSLVNLVWSPSVSIIKIRCHAQRDSAIFTHGEALINVGAGWLYGSYSEFWPHTGPPGHRGTTVSAAPAGTIIAPFDVVIPPAIGVYISTYNPGARNLVVALTSPSSCSADVWVETM